MRVESLLAASAAKIIILASIIRNVIRFSRLHRHTAYRIYDLSLLPDVGQVLIRPDAGRLCLSYLHDFCEDTKGNFLGQQPAETKTRRRSDLSEAFARNAFRCQRFKELLRLHVTGNKRDVRYAGTTSLFERFLVLFSLSGYHDECLRTEL